MSAEQPSIHDNRVYGYTVDCARRTVVSFTEFGDTANDAGREFTDVVFTGVLAHYFEHVLEGSILFGVELVEPGRIVEEWRDLFDRGIRYGWPIPDCRTRGNLSSRLLASDVQGFEISSSYGMSGWVLADRMELRPREPRAALP